MYSDISTRIIACSFPKIASARAFDISVFPTPVGPKNKKEPIGLLGSFRPTRPRRTAFATAETASSWPITRLCKIFSNFRKRTASSSAKRFTGILVQPDIISATASSSTVRFFFWISFFAFAVSFSAFFSSSSFSLRHSFAAKISPCSKCVSSSSSFSEISRRNPTSSEGFFTPPNRTFAQASSIKSIALSGKKRSLI